MRSSLFFFFLPTFHSFLFFSFSFNAGYSCIVRKVIWKYMWLIRPYAASHVIVQVTEKWVTGLHLWFTFHIQELSLFLERMKEKKPKPQSLQQFPDLQAWPVKNSGICIPEAAFSLFLWAFPLALPECFWTVYPLPTAPTPIKYLW